MLVPSYDFGNTSWYTVCIVLCSVVSLDGHGVCCVVSLGGHGECFVVSLDGHSECCVVSLGGNIYIVLTASFIARNMRPFQRGLF
jgi:hypothetical protein